MSHTCPECAEETVTLTPDRGSIRGDFLADFILLAMAGDELRVTCYCWECEWEAKKTLTIEVEL